MDPKIGRCLADDERLSRVAEIHVTMPTSWDPQWVAPPDMRDATRELMTEQIRGDSGLVLAAGVPELVAFLWAFDPAPGAEDVQLHIASLWVASQLRRRGMAGRLMAELQVLAQAQGVQRLTSEVHEANVLMNQLNEGWGFQATSRAGEWTHYTKDLCAIRQ